MRRLFVVADKHRELGERARKNREKQPGLFVSPSVRKA